MANDDKSKNRGPKSAPIRELPAPSENRLYGTSGYTGPNAYELARQAGLTRDVEMTDEVFLALCDRLIEGEPLVRICADTTMPSTRQLMRYLHKNEKAREIYYAAKEIQAEMIFEEAQLVANDDSNDFSFDDKGRRIAHNDVVARARLKVDQLNRTAAKLAPRRFGDKNVTEISGNPNAPVAIQVVTGIERKPGSLIGGQLAAPKIIEGVAIEGKDAAD